MGTMAPARRRSRTRASAPPPRRWPGFLAVLILAAILLVGGITVWFGATQFVPLRADDGGAYSTVRVQTGQPTRVEAVEPSTRRTFVAFDVSYRDGEWMEYGFTLINDSPFSVTIEQIGVSPAPDEALQHVSVSINAPDAGLDRAEGPDRMVRFRPVRIPPHGERYVLIRKRFTGCALEENLQFASQHLRFRIHFGWLSVDRSASLALPYSVKVSGNEGCPA